MNLRKSICNKLTLPLAFLALFCGCKRQEEKPAPPPAAGTPIVSAEKTSFDEVTAKLDKGGNFYLYLSTEQVLGGLSEKMSGISNFVGTMAGMGDAKSETISKIFNFANNWAKDSGIEQISGLGMSSIAREPGFYYGKMVVHHYPGQNQGVIWSVAGKEPHPLKELDLLPASTALATFSDFDLALVWQDVQKHVKQLDLAEASKALEQWPDVFRKKTGLDFDKALDSLGGVYGVILTLDQQKKISLPLPSGAVEIASPGLAIIVKVKSDVIFDRVDELCKGNALVVRVDTADLKMRTMTIPLPLPIELRPSIARSGDYLLLATSDTMVQEILAVETGKTKGFKSTAEFAHLSQGIPTTGNNFSLMADQFMKTMMQFQQQTLTNNGKMTTAQVTSLQHAFNSSTNFGNFSVGVNGPEGWEGFANGSQSIQSSIIPLVAGIGVAAAIAIPNFIKARAAAQQHASAAPNPEAAKQQWATEKGNAWRKTAVPGALAQKN